MTFLILGDFLMVERLLLSLQVKRNVIISSKLVYTSCLTLPYLKTSDLRKLGNIRKISSLHETIA